MYDIYIKQLEGKKMITEEEMSKKILRALTTGTDDWEQAVQPMKAEITTTEKQTLEKLVVKPSLEEKIKDMKGFKTGTFLDTIFLDANEKALDGVPFGSTLIMTGLPNTGKSLMIIEMVLNIANDGHKICFVTSEEIFRTETQRYDLESRMKERAKILGLDWKKISDNLHVLDAVAFAELRNWETFAKTYRTLVETNGVEFLAVDSLTLLEDSRGQLKYRLLETVKYGQRKGITSILINQRSADDSDSFSMAGGLSLSHIADVVFVLDTKKVWSGDGQMKLDMNVKQGDVVNFFHILKNRMGRYKANYFQYEITKDGLVRLVEPQTNPT